MRFNLYTVYDELAEEAGPIFCAKNDAVAERQFIALKAQIAETERSKYHLYFLGEYDNGSMIVDGQTPIKLAERIVEADCEN